MKKEEMLKLCKYYKGEEENPYYNDNKEFFWQFECNYYTIEYFKRHEYWETEGIKMASEFDEAKTVMDRYNDITIKGFIAYMAIMQMYNAPYKDCLEFMLDYGKDN